MGFKMDWKKTLVAYLPAIGGAIGGPLAGIAINAGLKAFGSTDEEIKNLGVNGLSALKSLVMNATPEQVSAAQISDKEFHLEMARQNYRSEKLNVNDRISARDLAKKMGAVWHHIVGLALITSCISIMFYMVIVGLPPDTNDFAILMIGNLQGWASAYIVFLYGSSKGSKEKDLQITDLIKTISEK